MKSKHRIQKAVRILEKLGIYKPIYLGAGFSGVVFHDGKYVYKVHIPLANNNYGEMDGILYLLTRLKIFDDSIHFYKLEKLYVDEVLILKYLYEKDEGVGTIQENEFIDFLAEMWQKKIICKSITKEKNFIRVNGIIKFIDYEILPYNDNLFLNLAARAFLYTKFPDKTELEYNKLKRSIINNFTHPVLGGFDLFLKKLFTKITFQNRDNDRQDSIPLVTSESIFWENLDSGKFITEFKIEDKITPRKITPRKITLNQQKKKVTLLIKACAQDSPTIYMQVKHIVHQLSSPNKFYEIVIAIDKKENNFLRQYTDKGNLKELYENINKLKEENIIDYYIELPESEIEKTNYKWFNLKTNYTHTYNNIPVTAQIFAFEKVKGDYILQVDSDVLIGREDYNHSFIDDMISALEANKDAISVGFNIYKGKSVEFTPYRAKPGEYKPEVRFALLHKKRLLTSLPLPNNLINGKLKLGWYHALHLYQKRYMKSSLRGGDRRSYYIHPQNYRKKCPYLWAIIMDRIEKGFIPEIQKDEFDLAGSIYDWAIPKRNEDIVVVVVINKETNIDKFFRFYKSLKNQSFKNLGIIIINTDNNLLKDKIIFSYVKRDKNTTYINSKIELPNLEALYIAIHYFINNLDTYVLLANPNDFFVGNNSILEIFERLILYKGDILIGKSLGKYNLKNNGYLSVDFLNPYNYNSNLYNLPKVFKKKLFEELGPYSFKKEIIINDRFANFERLSKKFSWFEDYEYINLFSILVNYSQNPIRFDHINYFVDRDIDLYSIKKYYDSLSINDNKHLPFRKIDNNRFEFVTNLYYLEIDITYDCNLKCVSCNRSCTQAPTKEYMTVKQIENFIKESIELKKKWKFINILGGEPTLHPDFEKIIELIYKDYILNFSRDTILQITSNGFTEESRNLLDKIEKLYDNIVIDRASFKTTNKVEYFTPFNNAPIDNEEFKNCDFSKGCWVTSYCGIGLNRYGYYPCSVAGGIDRVIGLDKGIKSLKDVTPEKMKDLLNTFCRYCGNFIDYKDNMGNFIPRCEKSPLKNNIISETWKKFYYNYKIKKPILTTIYE